VAGLLRFGLVRPELLLAVALPACFPQGILPLFEPLPTAVLFLDNSVWRYFPYGTLVVTPDPVLAALPLNLPLDLGLINCCVSYTQPHFPMPFFMDVSLSTVYTVFPSTGLCSFPECYEEKQLLCLGSSAVSVSPARPNPCTSPSSLSLACALR